MPATLCLGKGRAITKMQLIRELRQGDLEECSAYDLEETDRLSGTVSPWGPWTPSLGQRHLRYAPNSSQLAPAVDYHQSSITRARTRLHASRPVTSETARCDSRLRNSYEWLDRAPTGFAEEALRSSLR